MKELSLKITDQTKHLAAPENPRSRMSDDEKEKLAMASKQFESMMVGMMLKSMTESNGGLFGDDEGFGGDSMDVFFQQHLSSMMSNSGNFGIANQIYKAKTGEDLDPSVFMQHPVLKAPQRSAEPMKKRSIEVDSDSPVEGISPSGSAMARLEKYESIIRDASQEYGVPVKLIKSIILTESAAIETAKSSANAKGLMQLIDPTARAMGVKNSWDPRQNIFGGTKYISMMLDRYDGNLKLALAAYNAGPGNVDKYNGIPPFKETQNYVVRVMGYMNNLGKGEASDA
ncbi:Membrane-bound lytic murein transglycosylase F [Candidatus Brocadiaceae bacterium]|nr:Membrane-bound lytic murein transglycosylase F [Candidatus Brocadiaceae bacterium]